MPSSELTVGPANGLSALMGALGCPQEFHYVL